MNRDLVDIMAKAAHERPVTEGAASHRARYAKRWGEGHPSIQARLRADMEAAVAALGKAGYAIVPKGPTCGVDCECAPDQCRALLATLRSP